MFKSEQLIRYMDKFNNAFYAENGYKFCRCYSCVLPILVKRYLEIKEHELSIENLKDLIEDINNDYLLSGDYRIGERLKSGLVCGYDCRHYEEKAEACPFIFWEVDKTKWNIIISLLETEEFISLFTI